MVTRPRGRLFIGTSGWTYRSWKGPFYPDDLPSRDYLAFYAREFSTTEINYSFYHLPRPETFAKWATQVPEAFVFAVKASRFISHIKRLLDVGEPWRTFVGNALALHGHLGPILLQFPPSFRKDTTRLATFLETAQGAARERGSLRLVVEFRHDSWFTEEIYRLLSRHKVALCIADGAKYSRRDVLTTDFVYLRYHGRNKMFASDYSDAELREEARAIKRYLRDRLDVYAYFNNDAMGYAVKNARTLRRFLNG
ncbi:DUF72 domain-containing protein [Candidatus Nitrospira bockiana]